MALHGHDFQPAERGRSERRVWAVMVLTAAMMLAEIVAGTLFGSMALLADGWHMATHAGAMLIAALAYYLARRFSGDARFTFGTGKLGDLGGFTSAVVLGLIALMIAWESLLRFSAPVAIDIPQAVAVAVLGLVVNLVSAWLLRDDHHDHGHHHSHHHGHDHPHAQDHHHAPDNNLRAAYLHVLADALTSVLAIVALGLGGMYGWYWADPLMGIVGALVIARWSFGLMRDTGRVLLDAAPEAPGLAARIRARLAPEGVEITDLHVWQLAPGHHGAILALGQGSGLGPERIRALLAPIVGLSHVTVEVAGP